MIINRPRTKEDFNRWFIDKGGDPWNYQSESITSRLRDSLNFISGYLSNDYKGSILELGAFHGDFTYLLCQNFSMAEIVVNDISDVALNVAKKRVEKFSNVTFLHSDLLDLDRNMVNSNSNGTIILLLECLYYLKDSERESVMKNLKINFPASGVFLSTPIIGGYYFTEDALVSMMKQSGYLMINHRTLNLRKWSYLKTILAPIANHVDLLRKNLANQVIYYFKPV